MTTSSTTMCSTVNTRICQWTMGATQSPILTSINLGTVLRKIGPLPESAVRTLAKTSFLAIHQQVIYDISIVNLTATRSVPKIAY